VANFLPDLLGAVVVLLAGWIVARVLRGIAVRGALALDRLLERAARARGLAAERIPRVSADILGNIVFWIVALLFATAAAEVVGLAAFSEGLQRVFAYLPTLVAGGLIVLAGFLVGVIARDMVVAAAPASFHERALLGRIVQVSVVATAIVIGADQVGIDVTFLIILAAIMLGSIAGAVAVALGLGARTFVSNLIGAHYLRKAYRIGQQVRMGGVEGRILELSMTGVILETEDGRVTVPAKLFHEEPVILRMRGEHDDQGA
ncbi:MAG TPA: mechanosensitive ion channel domain-containing protein, partial [Gammaproteobacteria bacterium]|nr:mechanosensitive ion channel domain-containing protein [Gammaproteobacteria bacterium]